MNWDDRSSSDGSWKSAARCRSRKEKDPAQTEIIWSTKGICLAALPGLAAKIYISLFSFS